MAPYPLKVLAASARGLKLRQQRYGGHAEDLVAGALEREHWSADDWLAWQAERRAGVLAHAVARVPYYREWFATHPDLDPDDASAWPVVSKRDLQRSLARFVADDAPKRRVEDQTSGTSGTPLTVVSSAPVLRSWFALYEARARRWHGVSRHDRWAIIGGKMVASPLRSRPPYWVWNPGLNQLYLAANCLSEDSVADYVRALARHRPTHVVAYPSSLAFLARVARAAGLQGDGPRVVIANAEPVHPDQREVIEAFFACPVRETYGMAEMVAGATECEAGTMHLWPEAGIVEVLDPDNQPVAVGEVGRLVVTGLLNDVMPLIRYDIGDRVRSPQMARRCECGRGLPILPPVEGRGQDMILTPSGRRVFWLNPVFYGLPVAEAQIVQETIERLRIIVVPTPGFGPAAVETITMGIRDRVGPMEVVVEERKSIERGPGGKFRPLVSHISSSSREAVAPPPQAGEQTGAVGEMQSRERSGQDR